jgi:hypothetical protein
MTEISVGTSSLTTVALLPSIVDDGCSGGVKSTNCSPTAETERIDAFEFSGIFADESIVSLARTPFGVSETELTLPTLTPRKETFAFW